WPVGKCQAKQSANRFPAHSPACGKLCAKNRHIGAYDAPATRQSLMRTLLTVDAWLAVPGCGSWVSILPFTAATLSRVNLSVVHVYPLPRNVLPTISALLVVARVRSMA